MSNENKVIFPWVRVAILIGSIALLGVLSWLLTGKIFPSDQKESLIFQNALLLIVFGSALLEYKFTKPADSAVNSLMGCLTLLPVYGMPSKLLWWVVFLYCVMVFIFAMVCISVSLNRSVIGLRKRISEITYQPAVILGSSRILFSIVFLYAVFSFYGVQSYKTALLVLFWGVFISIWPLKLPELLSKLGGRKNSRQSVGYVVRTDAPNIVHVVVTSGTDWAPNSFKILQQGDGNQKLVLPLYSQSKDNQMLGTGLCCSEINDNYPALEAGHIYEASSSDTQLQSLFEGGGFLRLVGFVDKDSNISQIRFQTWNPASCNEGMLVYSEIYGKKVYYQVTDGITEEEGIETDKHGYQIAIATQLGILNPEKGFEKYPWFPTMNTPIFSVPDGFGDGVIAQEASDFTYGNIPGTQIKVIGKFADMIEYHTAILGVTGSGKTELAFDLIKYAVANEAKVICIDLTVKYKNKLSDLRPSSLSLSPELSAELSQKILDVEAGEYGAGKEKKALNQLAGSLRRDISKILTDFLLSVEDNNKIGIISLDEISNTKFTLFITELYLTSLLNFARDNPEKCPKVLLVVEEAHTVMPETSTMGLGDYDSKGLVAKIAQIALQGRKYRVGLLVIAQRTATVSKTVLTQCNTIISFSCFDETSLGFFENIFGKTHSAIIPNLQFLQAVIFGKGVKSQRPVIVQIPFKAEKAGTK